MYPAAYKQCLNHYHMHLWLLPMNYNVPILYASNINGNVDFIIDRGINWVLKNKRPERLRDNLQECEVWSDCSSQLWYC